MKITTIFFTLALLLAATPPSSAVAKRSLSTPPRTIASRRRGYAGKADTTSHDKDISTVPRGGVITPKKIQRAAYMGVVVMAALERAVNFVFQKQGIKFPSLLGGCIFLFFSMLFAEFAHEGWGENILLHLAPGSALLAKWLPVFFVPGLAMLPLAPSVGDGKEIAKVLLVTCLGFLYSMTTVSLVVLFLRGMQGTLVKLSVTSKTKENSLPTPKPFSEDVLKKLATSALLLGAISIGVTKSAPSSPFQTPLQTAFWIITTFATYVWGARLPEAVTKVVHPLITSTLLTLGVVRLTAMATDVPFLTALKAYRTGSLDLRKTGAGDLLLFMLGPAVVSFANAMFSRRMLLKDNFFIVISAMLISSFGGLFGTAAFVKAIQLGGNALSSRLVRLSVLPRNVTTALAMAITNILGGDTSIAASVVVLTGIIGATYGRAILTAMGIVDPVTRGLGIGAAGQGMGVASLVHEPDAFPFAAMSMVLTAICSTVIVSIPSLRDALISVAVTSTTESVKQAMK